MTGNPKVQHDVPLDQLVRLKPHKLGRHYHRIPSYIREISAKYPRLLSDYFLRNFRINLELQRVEVHERVERQAECIFRFPLGTAGFAIQRSLLAEALECYYGGSVLPTPQMPPESTSEQRLRDRLGHEVLDILLHALLAGESPGTLVRHRNTYEEVCWEYLAEFQYLSQVTGKGASLFLFLDSHLVDELTRRHCPPSPRLNGQPEDYIRQLPVRLSCVLARLQMPLSQVFELRADDILPIRLEDPCDVEINQRKLFRGTIFEEDGALFLTALESVRRP